MQTLSLSLSLSLSLLTSTYLPYSPPCSLSREPSLLLESRTLPSKLSPLSHRTQVKTLVSFLRVKTTASFLLCRTFTAQTTLWRCLPGRAAPVCVYVCVCVCVCACQTVLLLCVCVCMPSRPCCSCKQHFIMARQ